MGERCVFVCVPLNGKKPQVPILNQRFSEMFVDYLNLKKKTQI